MEILKKNLGRSQPSIFSSPLAPQPGIAPPSQHHFDNAEKGKKYILCHLFRLKEVCFQKYLLNYRLNYNYFNFQFSGVTQ